jgi:hypothetical protein
MRDLSPLVLLHACLPDQVPGPCRHVQTQNRGGRRQRTRHLTCLLQVAAVNLRTSCGDLSGANPAPNRLSWTNKAKLDARGGALRVYGLDGSVGRARASSRLIVAAGTLSDGGDGAPLCHLPHEPGAAVPRSALDVFTGHAGRCSRLTAATSYDGGYRAPLCHWSHEPCTPLRRSCLDVFTGHGGRCSRLTAATSTSFDDGYRAPFCHWSGERSGPAPLCHWFHDRGGRRAPRLSSGLDRRPCAAAGPSGSTKIAGPA